MNNLPLIIGTFLLLGGIVGFWLLAWVTNLGDSRPFNPEWVHEVRTATRGRPRPPVPRVPIGVKIINIKLGYALDARKELVRNRFRILPALSLDKAHLYQHSPVTFLDSAGVVRALGRSARQLTPRNLHPYLDFADGTVVWRLEVRG